jgi:hypothetical protein
MAGQMRFLRDASPPMIIALALLAACSAPPAASLSSTAAVGLSSASAGLCSALAALPDTTAAARTFTNFAHSELHVLAAEQELDRSLQAAVLQAMLQVEEDIRQGSGAASLFSDLTTLKRWTDESLQALDVEVPACAG